MSSYTTINIDHITQLKKLVGDDHLTNDNDVLRNMDTMKQNHLTTLEVLIKPSSVEEVSQVMSYASKHKIPVTRLVQEPGLVEVHYLYMGV